MERHRRQHSIAKVNRRTDVDRSSLLFYEKRKQNTNQTATRVLSRTSHDHEESNFTPHIYPLLISPHNNKIILSSSQPTYLVAFKYILHQMLHAGNNGR